MSESFYRNGVGYWVEENGDIRTHSGDNVGHAYDYTSGQDAWDYNVANVVDRYAVERDSYANNTEDNYNNYSSSTNEDSYYGYDNLNYENDQLLPSGGNIKSYNSNYTDSRRISKTRSKKPSLAGSVGWGIVIFFIFFRVTYFVEIPFELPNLTAAYMLFLGVFVLGTVIAYAIQLGLYKA